MYNEKNGKGVSIMSILGLILGLWFIAIGAYCFYYASATKKTGDVKSGWIVGKNVQLTNCKNPQAFIDAIYQKTKLFGGAAILGGLGIIIGTAIKIYLIELISMVFLVIFYFWYSSVVKTAQKKYLSPSFRAKANRKL